MDLEAVISSMLFDSDLEYKPVCLLRDHFDLKRAHAIYIKEIKGSRDKLKEAEKALLAYRDDYFTKLAESLLEKGLVTKKQLDDSKSTRVDDGVIFLAFKKEAEK